MGVTVFFAVVEACDGDLKVIRPFLKERAESTLEEDDEADGRFRATVFVTS